MIQTGRAFAAAAIVSLLTACSAPVGPATPIPSVDPSAVRQAACQKAIEGVVQAVQTFVEPYNNAPASPSASTASTNSAPAQADIQAALEAAQRTVRENSCDEKRFTADLESGLETVTTRGAVATAVLRRLTASLTGRIPDKPGRLTVEPGAELRQVIAEAPAGSTIALPAGRFAVKESLVLLDGLSIVGEGAKLTRLEVSAAEAGIFVLTADLVVVTDLTLSRTKDSIGSGIVTGPSAVLSLSDVVIRGARADKKNQGGAGVHLSGEGREAAGRGTTLEVTDSQFIGNAWTGIAASGGHRVSIVKSTFRDNGQCGLCFLTGSEGSVTDSRFIDNGIGVAIVGDARPTILNNRITGGDVGIQASGKARPTVERNTIESAARAAVIYTDSAAGTLGHTTCKQVKYGIVLGPKALPTLIDNTCTLSRSQK